jgi:hypothetical protein
MPEHQIIHIPYHVVWNAYPPAFLTIRPLSIAGHASSFSKIWTSSPDLTAKGMLRLAGTAIATPRGCFGGQCNPPFCVLVQEQRHLVPTWVGRQTRGLSGRMRTRSEPGLGYRTEDCMLRATIIPVLTKIRAASKMAAAAKRGLGERNSGRNFL